MAPRKLQYFMSWWKQGLLACVPMAWKPQYPKVQIHCTEDSFLVASSNAQNEQIELPMEKNSQQQTEMLPDVTDCEITLHLDQSEVLQSTLQLPDSAERSLNAVLGHEIERHTPFAKEQIYYGYSISARDPVQKNINVHFSAIPRTRLDPILHALNDYGIKPHAACVPEQENLLPQKLRARLPRNAQRIVMPPLLLCIMLALACLYIPLWQQQQALQQLQQQIQQKLPVATKLQQLREQQQQKAMRGNFFNTQQDKYIPAIELLEHLTTLLPDDTALQSFKLDKGYITLSGESANASGLIALLEGSPLLHQPSFRSPVIHSDRTQRERFSISASLQAEEK